MNVSILAANKWLISMLVQSENEKDSWMLTGLQFALLGSKTTFLGKLKVVLESHKGLCVHEQNRRSGWSRVALSSRGIGENLFLNREVLI